MTELKIEHSRHTLVDQVEIKLINYFKDNCLRPGDSIPNENELSTSLGIGRTVLREALSRFKMTGMIQSRTKRGMILAEPSILSSLSRCVNPLLMNDITIRNLFEFRLSLEAGLTSSLFRKIRPNNLERLERIVAAEEAAGLQHPSPNKCDFHEVVYEIIGNKIVLEFQETILPILDHVMKENQAKFSALEEKQKKAGTFVSHRNLLNYIKKGDELGYIRALNSHFSIFGDYLNGSVIDLQ